MKEIYFGETKKIKAEGGFEPQKEKLEELLENGMIMKFFCSGCGHYAQLTKDVAEKYAETAGEDLPENPDDYFFQSTGCESCDAEMKMELKKI